MKSSGWFGSCSLHPNRAAGAFSGARVGLSALAADGEIFQVSHPAIALNRLKALKVKAKLAPKVALDHVFALLDRVDNLRQLSLSQVLRADGGINLRLCDDLARINRSYAVDVAERYVDTLVARDVNTKNACHKISNLTLPLLVARISANHAEHALALHDLAVFAHFFYRRPNFHSLLSFKITCPCDKSPGDNFTATVAPTLTRSNSGTCRRAKCPNN
jgi:hypothetical protein